MAYEATDCQDAVRCSDQRAYGLPDVLQYNCSPVERSPWQTSKDPRYRIAVCRRQMDRRHDYHRNDNAEREFDGPIDDTPALRWQGPDPICAEGPCQLSKDACYSPGCCCCQRRVCPHFNVAEYLAVPPIVMPGGPGKGVYGILHIEYKNAQEQDNDGKVEISGLDDKRRYDQDDGWRA